MGLPLGAKGVRTWLGLGLEVRVRVRIKVRVRGNSDPKPNPRLKGVRTTTKLDRPGR